MKNDCQREDELLRIHSYDDLPTALRFAVDRCADRVNNGETLPRKEIGGFDCYAYAIGDQISRGVNGLQGINIFRDKIPMGNERNVTMPKKLKIKFDDWKQSAKDTNPEMFDPPPLKIVDNPVKSPLAKEQMTTEQKKTTWRRALGWFK